MEGFYLGLLAAVLLSVGVSLAFRLSSTAAFLIGLALGFICVWIGTELDA